MSHCGGFYFDNNYVSGCVQSCFEDACNGAHRQLRELSTDLLITLCFALRVLFVVIGA